MQLWMNTNKEEIIHHHLLQTYHLLLSLYIIKNPPFFFFCAFLFSFLLNVCFREDLRTKKTKKKKKKMDGRKQSKAALYEKLEQLRSATNSTAMNKASILVDASRYIQELKERVEKLNEDVATLQSSSSHDQEDSLPKVKVETLEKGFLINVFSDKNCPGLLVSILEAFEELGLEVLDARVSCSDNFRLEAVSENEGQSDNLDAQVVRQAVLQAIRGWSNNQQDD